MLFCAEFEDVEDGALVGDTKSALAVEAGPVAIEFPDEDDVEVGS